MNKWLVRLGYLGLLIVLAFGIGMAQKQIIASRLNQSETIIKQVSEDKIEENDKKNVENEDTIEPLSLNDIINATQNAEVVKDRIIGIIQVKEVGISIPILKGTTNENLAYGATTYKDDQKMGEGNYILFGHHMRNESLLFGSLGRTRIGTEVVISDLKNEYIYTIKEKKTIKDTDLFEIDDHNKDELTLITCDTSSLTENRWLVRAELSEVKKVTSKEKLASNLSVKKVESVFSLKTTRGWQLLNLFLCILFVLLITIVAVQEIQNRRKRG